MEEPSFWCCTAILLYLCGQTKCIADTSPKLPHFFSLYNLIKRFFFLDGNTTSHTAFPFLNFCFHGFIRGGTDQRQEQDSSPLHSSPCWMKWSLVGHNAEDRKMILPSWIIRGYCRQKLTVFMACDATDLKKKEFSYFTANICKMSGKEEAEGKPYCSLQFPERRL